MKTLLREVVGRLTGQTPSNNPIIRLETSFGGGKTHNLIALYHAVKGQVDPADNITTYGPSNALNALYAFCWRQSNLLLR